MISVMISSKFISVQGHAGFNPGNDIVCASVSALVQTFEASAREFTTDPIKSHLEDGHAVVAWPKETSKELALLIDSLYLGLSRIAEAYPENVQVTCTR